MITANRAVVDYNVPCPQSDGVPLERFSSTRFRQSDSTQSRTFLTSNRFLASPAMSFAPDFAVFVGGASVMSMSVMVIRTLLKKT